MANAFAIKPNDIEAGGEELTNQYVTFQAMDEVFGISMASVLEIIRLPDTVQVPLTSSALVGLANLRGSVLPVLDLRRMMQLDDAEYNDATRVVVVDVGSPVGLVVDKVSQVMNIEPDRIDNSGQMQSVADTELLAGVIKGREGEPLTQLLNVEQLIAQEFSAVLSSATTHNTEVGGDMPQTQSSNEEELDDTDQLVSFVVEDQEYAFNLMEVEEIVRVPGSISKVPRTDNHVLGLINLRGRLLPLVSLRHMFALAEAPLNEDNRILVVSLQQNNGRKDSVGLVVDNVKEVLRVSQEEQDAMPALLSKGEDGSDIACVCRLEKGKRLVSVLRAESLFTHPVIQAAIEAREGEEESEVIDNVNLQDHEAGDDTAQLVVFHLGEQEYGVSIDNVQEITRVPEKLDKVPKTASFIEGMVNLRGTVLPVLDMRTRFEMQKMERNERQRIIVLSLTGIRTGFIVDSVAEVLRLPLEQIETAPSLSEDQARIMGQVVNLKESKRMIQVLTAHELLSETEMATISKEGQQADNEAPKLRRKDDRKKHPCN